MKSLKKKKHIAFGLAIKLYNTEGGCFVSVLFSRCREHVHTVTQTHTDTEHLDARDVRHHRCYFTESEQSREIKWVIQDGTLVKGSRI